MNDTRKCECGHTNPVGTRLCEACGKPTEAYIQTQDPQAPEFPSMRYEGMARRSKINTRSPIDKVWNFFSSVKIAIILIVITLIASGVGTIFPQQRYIPVPVPTEESVAQFYSTTYGTLGDLYYLLGFHNLYSSWWFVTLLVMIGMSLVICSLDRIIPLYKALKKPRLNQHLSFYLGQKMHGVTDEGVSFNTSETLEKAAEGLKKKGYRVFQNGDSLMGEKARFSRWGPYINHVGLILFLLGVLLRSVPGFYMDDFVWVREGQTISVPNTPYYVKNVEYKTEYYSEDEFAQDLPIKEGEVIPKNFESKLIIYLNENEGVAGAPPKLTQVTEGSVRVNHPLTHESISYYQSGKREMELGALNFDLVNRTNNQRVGQIKVDLYEPAAEQKVGEGITVRVLDYYPDFFMDKNGMPSTKSSAPNNPMVALEVSDGKVKEKLVYVSGSLISNETNPVYELAIRKPDLLDVTGLMVRKDTMIPLIYFGCFISMVGLVMGFYWQHRRIWFHREGDRLYLAGHTNKNWFGLRQEVNQIIEPLQLPIPITVAPDVDKKKSKKEKEVRPT
ncbi:cytochrome c biogenesis protein ResB [Brevibacillus dissolubilis]|uniref:cytochrome c biogenesis protein ResB n=1 Tax=Brevibacillus dissolubilis TaxID=1844116 RepID=UPI0011179445|nr:cytochrome c biogenesis protein ResB [Brevibacillus dissolubilis]